MSILYILLALVVLLIMITVHEFGHYIAGKIFGFKINEFSIGFGPAMYKRTRKDGEVFAIRALPLGGYCAFEGEDEDGKDKPDAFNSQPAWKRLIVLLSGVAFNFLFGILTGAIFLFAIGNPVSKITYTISNQGVSTYGLQKNDIIIAVEGKSVEYYRTFSQMSAKFGENEEFYVTVNRDGKTIDIKTKKQKFPAFYFISDTATFKEEIFIFNNNEYKLLTLEEFDSLSQSLVNMSTENESGDNVGTGEAIKPLLANYYYKINNEYKSLQEDSVLSLLINGDENQKIYPLITYVESGLGFGAIHTEVKQPYTVLESVTKSWPFCFDLCDKILDALGGLFNGATEIKDMGGTVTAVSQIAEISQMGINYFLLLLPLLAMNLALFNILPIPSLDGARALFVFIELIFRKPVPRKIEGWIHAVGLILLLGLVIFFDVYHFAVAAKLIL